MIIHYNCTIGSILLDSFLLIYHPYPPSFHEMIFILVLYIHTSHTGHAVWWSWYVLTAWQANSSTHTPLSRLSLH